MATYEFYANSTDNDFASYDYEESPSKENYIVNALRTINKIYKPVHGYFAGVLCVFGITTNILNAIVLTRKNVTSNVNIFLTALAISDCLMMAIYLPYLILMYLVYGTTFSPERNTEGAVRYELIFAISSIIIHSISIWLTVTLAVFRYLFIRFPRKGARFGNTKLSVGMVIVVVLAANIINIPNTILYQLESMHVLLNGTGNSTTVKIWRVIPRSDIILQHVNFWIYAILTKLCPCFLLLTFSVLLLRIMRKADKRRNEMTVNNTFALRTKRTTKMLLSVVILTVITQTPHGILVLLSGLIPDFYVSFYEPLGDLMDILTLINHGVNFVLYCTMSEEFRTYFLSLFCRCVVKSVARRSRSPPRRSIFIMDTNLQN